MIAIRVFSFGGIDCESAARAASGIKSEAISKAMGENGVFIIDFRPQTCSAFASCNPVLTQIPWDCGCVSSIYQFPEAIILHPRAAEVSPRYTIQLPCGY